MSTRQRSQQSKGHEIAIEAPNAKTVVVTGCFCGWDPVGHPLKRHRNGTWKTKLLLPPGQYEYRLLVDDQWQDDPTCGDRVPNSFGTENCILRV